MLRAWKARDSLKDEAAAKPWFLTIIRREYARTFERKRLATVDVDELIAKEEPMLAAAQDQDLAELRAALFKLPGGVPRAAGAAGADGLFHGRDRRRAAISRTPRC